MTTITELRDKAITTGVNTVLPLYAKVAPKVNELVSSPVGRKVTALAGKGIEYAGKGVEAVAPVVDRVEKLVKRGDDTPQAVTPGETTASRPAAKTQAKNSKPAKTTKAAKAPVKKTAAKRPSSKKPSSKKPASKTSAAAPDLTAEGTAVAPVAGTASVAATDLPLAGYDSLVADEIIARLDGLTVTELATLSAYEKSNDNRSTIVQAIDSRITILPLPTYDSLEVPAILSQIETLSPQELLTIRNYEISTKNRLPVVERIDSLLG